MLQSPWWQLKHSLKTLAIQFKNEVPSFKLLTYPFLYLSTFIWACPLSVSTGLSAGGQHAGDFSPGGKPPQDHDWRGRGALHQADKTLCYAVALPLGPNFWPLLPIFIPEGVGPLLPGYGGSQYSARGGGYPGVALAMLLSHAGPTAFRERSCYGGPQEHLSKCHSNPLISCILSLQPRWII